MSSYFEHERDEIIVETSHRGVSTIRFWRIERIGRNSNTVASPQLDFGRLKGQEEKVETSHRGVSTIRLRRIEKKTKNTY